MTLSRIEISVDTSPPTQEIQQLIKTAKTRAQDFLDENRVPAFVTCDFEAVHHAVRAVRNASLATGNVFCEWGSGFGAVAGIASSFGFESYGIEIEGALVDEAVKLADEFNLSVEFIHGSIVPTGAESIVETTLSSDVCWLVTESDDAYSDLNLDPDDLDIVFAYPWPGEEDVIHDLFDHCAAIGALLMTYSYYDDMRVFRKVG